MLGLSCCGFPQQFQSVPEWLLHLSQVDLVGFCWYCLLAAVPHQLKSSVPILEWEYLVLAEQLGEGASG
jgi:hypothetical protein